MSWESEPAVFLLTENKLKAQKILLLLLYWATYSYTRKMQYSPEVKSMASGESCQCLNPARHLLVVWPGASYMTSLCLDFFISKIQITTVPASYFMAEIIHVKCLEWCLEHNMHSKNISFYCYYIIIIINFSIFCKAFTLMPAPEEAVSNCGFSKSTC